jgi:peptidoglycan/LPS O-acetylase OafA/YrhL
VAGLIHGDRPAGRQEAISLDAVLRATHLPVLDGLRALAVTMVVASHFGLASAGGLGVTIFFVLSGFLITWLLLKEREATGSVSLRAFYAKRTLRIFPAYYVFLAVSLAIDMKRGDPRIGPIARPAIFYYTNYFNALHGHSTSSVAHAWSLAVEEQFYLVWPVAFILLSASGPRRLVRALVIAIALVAVWRSYAYLWLGLGPSYVYNAFDCRFDCLAAGCLLAAACQFERFRNRMTSFVRTYRWAPLLTAAALLPLVDTAGGVYRYTFGFTVEALLIAFAVAQLLVLHAVQPFKLLDASPVRYLGRVSYGMYLYHQWGLAIGRHVPMRSQWMEFGAGLTATIVLASLSYFVIERPFLRLKTSLSRVPRPPQGVALRAVIS